MDTAYSAVTAASSQHGPGVAAGGGLAVAAGGPLQPRVSVLRQTPGVQERVQVRSDNGDDDDDGGDDDDGSLKTELQAMVLGGVAAAWDPEYEGWRRVHTRACCHKPILILRPRGQKVTRLH